jgi:hypothetical protein
MYIRVTGDSATYTTLTDLRIDFPNVSFPVVISDSDAAQFGVYPCTPVAAPEADYTKTVVMADPVKLGGVWHQAWAVTEASAEEVAARVEAKWNAIRSERDQTLAASDWTQLSDAPLSNIATQAWAAYRQALRDLTDQADPFAIAWPEAPGA